MKIDALKLVAFGPFTDKVLDFSGKGYGLHVVFGANEAGKSTALRALQALLYGFGHIVQDAWLHESNKLAVGGSLALGNGDLLHLTRYKRRKNDLINEATGQPFDQADLDTILGRMGREAFEHAFGISHDSLLQGVESVLAAGGDLGHALFAATSGLNTLKRVMTKLNEQQSLLFAPRAQKAHINAGVAELNKLRKKQREASASHHQWKKMKKRLDDLQQQEVEEIKQVEALGAEISLLSRHRHALKFVALREELEKEVSELGVVPDLAEDFPQRRVETQVAIKQSHEVERHLTQELAHIDKKLETLTYDEKIIANEALIKALADKANVHAQAALDGRGLRARIYQHNESAQQALDLLRSGLGLDSVKGLRLSKPEKAKIQRLGAKGAKLEASVDSAHKALHSAKAHLKKAQAELDQVEEPKDTSALADCLERAAEHGKLEERLAAAEAQVALSEDQVHADLAALGLWTGDISALERLALPAEETMRRFETDLADGDQKLADMEKEGRRIQQLLKDKEKALAELTQTRELPSVKDLKSHRTLRDKGWQSVRTVWLEGGDPDQGFMEAFPGNHDLALAYEQSVGRADDTADVLRDDADAVARADAFRVEIQDQKESLHEVKARRKELDEDRTGLWSAWLKLWEPLGIEPLTPREMTAWAGRAGELRRKVWDARDRRVAANQLREDMGRMRSDVATALEQIGVNVPEKISYAAIIELAKRTVRHHDRLRQDRLDLDLRIRALKEEIENSTERKSESEQNLDGWSADWARAISRLGFSKDARPDDVNDFVLALDDVFVELEKAKEKQQRIDAIEKNYRAYGQQVADSVAKLAPALKDLDPEAAAMELHGRLAGDKERRQEHRLLEDDKRKKHAALLKEQEKLAALEETIRLLCKDAHADNADQLPEIEKRAARKINLEGKLGTVNERLIELASGQNLEEFVSQVKTHDPDELVAKLDRLEAEKQESLKKQKSIVQDIALAEKELQSIGGESLAVIIAEEAEGLVGNIQSHVEHYVKLRLASAILTRAMERYRQSNQSPVLSAASEYFKTMTGESFAGLRADFDDKGDPVIKAIRPEGTLLSVREMSDGSRDQLFLSLRLGGLEKYIVNNGPMPFIVDDVLVHFDDDRSAAALETMADLAEKTQIIFFTHHQHLVALAEKSVPEEMLHVHHL
ncbi:MAG: AAA family ATPase [Thermodesulfobacteriota bacterium]|nr:AAA family ATPase [Thermodesulfobacteriota bacterium]